MKVNLRWNGRRVRCNTETARRIGTYRNGERTETLYRNRDGIFFLHTLGKGLYKNGPGGRERPLNEEEETHGAIRVLDLVVALDWCQHALPKQQYDFLFEGMPENPEDEQAWLRDGRWESDPNPLTERFSCTLPSGLVRRLERTAQERKLTKSRLVELALIRYLNEGSEEK